MGDWLKSVSDIASYAKNAAQTATTMVAGSDLERKLAEAMSNEPWGASGAPPPPASQEPRARARTRPPTCHPRARG